MIIDFHSHDFPDAIAIRAMAGMTSRTDGHLWPVGDGTLTNHLDYLDLYGIDRAVVSPIATKPNMFEGILHNALRIRDGEFGERAQRKLIPFASVHPLDPNVNEHLQRIADSGIKGVKFHCYYQDFSLADKECWPVFEKVADLGLVMLCHCGDDISWPGFHGLCGPREIALLMHHVPNLKLVAAHLGGLDGYAAHAIDPLLDTGCYIDTSMLHRHWFYDEQMRVLRSWPRERILFGTDFPWVHYPEAIAWVKSVRDRQDWEQVFWRNAARLLGL